MYAPYIDLLKNNNLFLQKLTRHNLYYEFCRGKNNPKMGKINVYALKRAARYIICLKNTKGHQIVEGH